MLHSLEIGTPITSIALKHKHELFDSPLKETASYMTPFRNMKRDFNSNYELGFSLLPIKRDAYWFEDPTELE
jgi:hypothetical protein